jgi:hypothetical protein
MSEATACGGTWLSELRMYWSCGLLHETGKERKDG